MCLSVWVCVCERWAGGLSDRWVGHICFLLSTRYLLPTSARADLSQIQHSMVYSSLHATAPLWLSAQCCLEQVTLKNKRLIFSQQQPCEQPPGLTGRALTSNHNASVYCLLQACSVKETHLLYNFCTIMDGYKGLVHSVLSIAR